VPRVRMREQPSPAAFFRVALGLPPYDAAVYDALNI
jgi:hypothetical protein